MKTMKTMKRMKIMLSLVMALGFSLGNLTAGFGAEAIKLPPPATKGTVSLEEALQNRRSTRKFANRSLELAQISQLLWAADGINNPQGKRTAPSGRAAYPIDLYLVVGEAGRDQPGPRSLSLRGGGPGPGVGGHGGIPSGGGQGL